MKYTVSYPSGSELTVTGQPPRGHADGGTLLLVAIEQSDDKVVALDPRAIIRNPDDDVVYHPYMIALDTCPG